MDFQKQISIRWSDIDANYHLRHSVYYDFGAQFRTELLHRHGVTMADMQEKSYGPVLFREECIFKREITMSDMVTINFKLKAATEDFSKWSIQHEFFKNENKLCAVLTIDGAWIDTKLRRLAAPPEAAKKFLEFLPKTSDFRIF
jgi:acyl-CoA thioester hydrolase